MRALSVRQPWASLIADGCKSIEIRTWKTSYRGPVIIFAGARPWQGEHEHELGPLGSVVAIVELYDCKPFDCLDAPASCVPERELRRLSFESPKQWYSWFLRDARHIAPLSAKGKLGLYTPSPEIVRAVQAR